MAFGRYLFSTKGLHILQDLQYRYCDLDVVNATCAAVEPPAYCLYSHRQETKGQTNDRQRSDDNEKAQTPDLAAPYPETPAPPYRTLEQPEYSTVNPEYANQNPSGETGGTIPTSKI